MANKKKLQLGSIQANKLIDQLPAKREQIKANVQFRHDLLESQKRVNYQHEFDRLQGAKKLTGLNPNVKSQMQELKKKARQSLNGEPSQRIYSTKL
uniref:hypothetical protein n=1 Tax=Flavobacterium sp. TaxID=239 RepID=UPI00404B1D15